MAIYALLACFVLAVVLVTAYRSCSPASTPRGLKSLPGPKGHPIVGSVPSLASKNPWLTFHEWGQQYGPIYQVSLAGSNHIWISDERIAHELLAKRGARFSDRPHIPALAEDNRTCGRYLPLLSKNEKWKRQRGFATHIMRETQANAFYGHPELEARRLMKELLDTPGRYDDALESYIARVTCRLAWGKSEASGELKQRARELLLSVSPTGALGNKLPFVMSLPDILSPAKVWEQRRARTEKAFFMAMQDQVRALHEQGLAPPSWTRAFLKNENGKDAAFDGPVEGAYAVGMHGIAGALTIAAPMMGFCLAICKNPHVLSKLHDEIDRVCGETPPQWKDIQKLPYLRACIRETLRWRPPVPTGIPHEMKVDDEFEGFHLPGPSTVHPFEWGMSRNETLYPHAEDFMPERWTEPEWPTYREPLEQYPTVCEYSQFGFGRRTCLGQEVVEADLVCGVGAIAWAFDIGRAVDEETGDEVPVPDMDYSELLIAKPKHFQFAIAARSEKRAARVEQLFEEGAASGAFPPERQYWDEGNAEYGWGRV